MAELQHQPGHDKAENGQGAGYDVVRQAGALLRELFDDKQEVVLNTGGTTTEEVRVSMNWESVRPQLHNAGALPIAAPEYLGLEATDIHDMLAVTGQSLVLRETLEAMNHQTSHLPLCRMSEASMNPMVLTRNIWARSSPVKRPRMAPANRSLYL